MASIGFYRRNRKNLLEDISRTTGYEEYKEERESINKERESIKEERENIKEERENIKEERENIKEERENFNNMAKKKTDELQQRENRLLKNMLHMWDIPTISQMTGYSVEEIERAVAE